MYTDSELEHLVAAMTPRVEIAGVDPGALAVLPSCRLSASPIGCYLQRFARWLRDLLAPSAPTPAITPIGAGSPLPSAPLPSHVGDVSRVRRWMAAAGGGRVEPEDVALAAMAVPAVGAWGVRDPPRPAMLGEIHDMTGASAGARAEAEMAGSYDPEVAADARRREEVERMLREQVSR